MPEVLVVGVGIVGAACAYRLAEAGLEVLVLEREATFAQGSTGKSAAGVRVQFSEPLNILLSYHSILEYQRIPEASYRPIGYLFLVPDKTPKGEVAASLLLLCTGAWTGEVGKRLGLEIPIRPVRRMVFATAPAPFPHAFPLTIDLATGFYLRSEGARVLMGRSNPDEPPGFSEGMDWRWLAPTLEAGLSRFPFLEGLALDRRASWWGYYEMIPDANPILGFVEEGLLVAAGFSGHGVQQAAMVGRLMAEEVVYGKARSLDITPFRLDRFREGRFLKEKGIV